MTVVARSEERGRAAVARISGSGPQPDLLVADLASQAAVRRLAGQILERYPHLDVLVNNAGAIHTRRRLTEDGIELTWAANHLAPFLLTTLLVDRLQASAPARVVTTSSDAHTGMRIPFDDVNADRGYGGFRRYGETKLANILFTAELARRLEGTGVTANCYHPGFVATGFNRNNGWRMRLAMAMARPFGRSPERGADTLVWLADSPDVSGESGAYFVDRRRAVPSPAARDDDAARRLWGSARTRPAPRRAEDIRRPVPGYGPAVEWWPVLDRVFKAHVVLYRATGGLIGHRAPFAPPMLLLDHVGAKTGKRRTTPLAYVADGDDVVVVASKGGHPRNPDWFHNLTAHPDTTIQVGSRRRPVHARVATPDERRRLWAEVVRTYGGYAGYQERTSRQIPLVILEPRPSRAG